MLWFVAKQEKRWGLLGYGKGWGCQCFRGAVLCGGVGMPNQSFEEIVLLFLEIQQLLCSLNTSNGRSYHRESRQRDADMQTPAARVGDETLCFVRLLREVLALTLLFVSMELTCERRFEGRCVSIEAHKADQHIGLCF